MDKLDEEEIIDKTPIQADEKMECVEEDDFGGFEDDADEEYMEKAKRNAMRRRGLNPKALNKGKSKENSESEKDSEPEPGKEAKVDKSRKISKTDKVNKAEKVDKVEAAKVGTEKADKQVKKKIEAKAETPAKEKKVKSSKKA
jgi:25S rRNA (cytosine2870-C5)-methyltransferase